MALYKFRIIIIIVIIIIIIIIIIIRLKVSPQAMGVMLRDRYHLACRAPYSIRYTTNIIRRRRL